MGRKVKQSHPIEALACMLRNNAFSACGESTIFGRGVISSRVFGPAAMLCEF
jgi:hypothetical protein